MKITLIATYIVLIALSSFSAFGSCSPNEAEIALKKACDIFFKKGKTGVSKFVTEFRFCGDNNNYVWFQEIDPDNKSIILISHPYLASKDMATHSNSELKVLFSKLDKALRASTISKPEEVNYEWLKGGDKKPSPKKSFMLKCDEKTGAGAGYWQ